MQTFLALLLACLSAISYFVVTIAFGIRQSVPWLHIVIGLLACVWLARLVRRGSKAQRLVRIPALVFGVALVLAFIWYSIDYSAYDRHGEAAGQGQTLSELGSLMLARHDDQVGNLLEGDSKATLLVLYRGHW